MLSKELEAISTTISHCKQLYRDLGEADELIKAFYRAREDFEQEHFPLVEAWRISSTAEEAQEKFRQGKQLLSQLTFKKELFNVFLDYLRAKVKDDNRNLAQLIEQLQEFITSKYDQTLSVDNAADLIQEITAETPLENDLATLLVTFALSSLSRPYLQGLPADLDTSFWDKGTCPVCGQSPHYGRLREKDGARVMECWLCETQWTYPRLQCPFCRNNEPDEQGFFTVAENEACRVHFCRKCQHYYKIFDLRNSDNEDLILTIHNLATLSYDLLAEKEGFKPGSGLQWVNEKEVQNLVN